MPSSDTRIVSLLPAATGTLPRARELVARLKARFAAVPCRVKAIGEGGSTRPKVAVIEWLDPPMAAGRVPELVRMAGGQDVVGRVASIPTGSTGPPWLQLTPIS